MRKFGKILLMDTLVEKLKTLGLNSYECKVYIALLKKSPATGYEISQLSDVPQSRAYDALKSLCTDNIVIAGKDKPIKYSPISPKELLRRYKRKINTTIDYLEKKLPHLEQEYNEPLHNITGYDNILNKIKEIINGSKTSLYMEIWSEDYKLLEQEIKKAYERDIDIKIVGYGDLNTQYALVYNHLGGRELEHAYGSRLIFVLSDSYECLFGKVLSMATWTQNKDVAFLLKEFIVHDMYLLDVEKNFPEQLKYFYGPGFKRLKSKILSKDTSYNIH